MRQWRNSFSDIPFSVGTVEFSFKDDQFHVFSELWFGALMDVRNSAKLMNNVHRYNRVCLVQKNPTNKQNQTEVKKPAVHFERPNSAVNCFSNYRYIQKQENTKSRGLWLFHNKFGAGPRGTIGSLTLCNCWPWQTKGNGTAKWVELLMKLSMKNAAFLTADKYKISSNFWKLCVGQCVLDEKLIELLNPYCPIITTFTNPVMAQQSTILIAVFAGTLMC